MKQDILFFAFCICNTGFLFAQNVGIGTTNPLNALHVESSGPIAGRFVNDGTTSFRKAIYAEAIGLANDGYGVHGIGNKFGVWGQSSSTVNMTGGVRGTAGLPGITISGYYGVLGESSGGKGVVGVSSTGMGILGYSNTTYGIRGESPYIGVYGFAFSSSTTLQYGVYGLSSSQDGGAGVRGNSPYVGVWGESTATSGQGWGIYGRSNSPDAYGGYFSAPTGTAGYFSGKVTIIGSLTKSSGSFKIDHPLDPENKYLYHSFVESPDMMNMYNGNVILDQKGEALISLPDWFEALNKDYRYQLTCIGGYAPVYISKKISSNGFRISGGTPGLEVSWQVTGIRKDAYAEQNRIMVEVLKPAKERGTYLHPEAFGKDASLGLDVKMDAIITKGAEKNQ
jgi:hypothetical protein